ncbi:MAG: hypothetical protein GY769_17775 [bacterium]|nr:hypothetical protein [bacterium]
MKKHCLLFALVISVPMAGLGQETATEYELDLADTGGSVKVDAGTKVQIKITHRLPAKSYRIDVEKAGLAPPLDFGVFEAGAVAGAISDECDAFLKARALLSKTDEAEFRSALAEARSLSPDTDCTNRINGIAASGTVTLPQPYTLTEGQTLTITVDRDGHDEWVFEFTSVEDRQWLVHYGFSFLPDEDEEFFSKAETGGTGFVVTPVADNDDLEFEPVVAFSYTPKGSLGKPSRPKFTAGLGADIDERLVFAGASWIIGDNVSLFVGAAGHEQTRLKGIYEVGQVLKETLQSDQLVDETFDVNALVGIGFRFNSNPFKKKTKVSTASNTVAPAAAQNGTSVGNTGSEENPGNTGTGEQPTGRETPPGTHG